MTGLLALAFGAGLVSAVNPCGFALLPAWIAYHLDTTTTAADARWSSRLAGGLRAGLALTAASVAGVLAVFAAYTLGAATFLLLLATSTAVAGGAFTRVLRRALPLLHRATGVIMLAAGVYLAAYWLPATWGGVPGRGVPDLAPVASDTAAWLQQHQAVLAAIAGLVLVAALTAVAVRHRPRPEPAPECCAPFHRSGRNRPRPQRTENHMKSQPTSLCGQCGHEPALTAAPRSQKRLMTVGELSERTGVSIKTLREYADTGLVYTVGRSAANYRLFDDDALWCIRWIGNLRSLGLTVAEVRELAAVYSTHADQPIGPHLAERLSAVRARLDARIKELEQMRQRVDDFQATHREVLAGQAAIEWLDNDPKRRAISA